MFSYFTEQCTKRLYSLFTNFFSLSCTAFRSFFPYTIFLLRNYKYSELSNLMAISLSVYLVNKFIYVDQHKKLIDIILIYLLMKRKTGSVYCITYINNFFIIIAVKLNTHLVTTNTILSTSAVAYFNEALVNNGLSYRLIIA